MKYEIELKVINEALNLLKTECQWKKDSELDEDCSLQKDKVTLGCALEIAQLKIRSKKINRSKEIRTVRKTVYWNYFFRAGIHPLTYFNRHKKTTYNDIINVLHKAIEKLS